MSEKKPAYSGWVEAPIGNYYGTPSAAKKDEGYVLSVTDWDGDPQETPVSREFYEAWVKEFGEKT